jgi:hypothetical protein
MGKREVAFGEKEKHTLEISWSDWTGVVSIKIDGQFKNYAPWRDLIPGVDSSRSYDYTVGTNEVHSVHVEIGYGGFSSPSTTVYADGKVIE